MKRCQKSWRGESPTTSDDEMGRLLTTVIDTVGDLQQYVFDKSKIFPGTTRDWLEATLTIEDVRIQLVDTAGRYETADAIEREAQKLGGEQARLADLIVWCWPVGQRRKPVRLPVPALHIATKADLGMLQAAAGAHTAADPD